MIELLTRKFGKEVISHVISWEYGFPIEVHGLTCCSLAQNGPHKRFCLQISPQLLWQAGAQRPSSHQPVTGKERERESERTRRTSGEETDSDSDSDEEERAAAKKERGVTEFWRRKMRTFHGILDLNKDGVISFEDLQVLGDRFVHLGHLSPPNQAIFYKLIQTMWEERWGSVEPYNTVSTEQYLDEMRHVLNDDHLRKKVHRFLPYLFEALDKDKSGLISVEEYKLFFKCLGLPDDSAVVAFSAIDENCDGQLSLKEFVKLGRDFFITEDHKRPSKMFWGPLVQ